MKQFKNVGRHPEDLDGGTVVGTAETVQADENDPRVQRLVAEGKFLPIEKQTKSTTRKEDDQ